MTKKQLLNIRQELKDLGITLSGIARAYGCSRVFVHQVLAGTSTSKPLIDFIFQTYRLSV